MTAHVFNLRVYWEDTDAGGLVYHANYLKFAERARTEMLRHLGIQQEKLRDETGMLFVVRRLVAEYLLPARLDDELAITCRAHADRAATIRFEQSIFRDRPGEGPPILTAGVLVACVDAHTLKPRRLPESLINELLSPPDTA